MQQDKQDIKVTKEELSPETSYFRVVFADGLELTEREAKWSSLAERRVVGYFGSEKVILAATGAVKRIEAYHEGLVAGIDVPVGCSAYQAIRSEAVIVPGVHRKDRIIGRLIGIVKDGEVIEELFLNALQFKVEGVRK